MDVANSALKRRYFDLLSGPLLALIRDIRRLPRIRIGRCTRQHIAIRIDLGMRNVTAIISNASDTGLTDQSIDLAFVFGLLHIADGIENVIFEVHRVLTPDGVLSFSNHHLKEDEIVSRVTDIGLFGLTGTCEKTYGFSIV